MLITAIYHAGFGGLRAAFPESWFLPKGHRHTSQSRMAHSRYRYTQKNNLTGNSHYGAKN